MKVPVAAKLAVIAVGATAFYTYVGQLVPQKEVHPPEVVEIAADVSTDQMVEIGLEIFQGKGLCTTCHTLGRSGALRFPDLSGVGERARSRLPGYSDLGYFAQTLYQPDAFIVAGFSPGMPPANKPPIGLTDDEIKAVVAYLQSLGGTPTITMQTVLVADGEPLAHPEAAPGEEPGGTATVDAQAAAAAVGEAGEIPEAAGGPATSVPEPAPPVEGEGPGPGREGNA
jgi:cytochrome c oxidase subunit 2